MQFPIGRTGQHPVPPTPLPPSVRSLVHMHWQTPSVLSLGAFFVAGKSYSGFVLNSHISLPQVEAGDLSEVLYPSHFPKSSGSLANTAAMRCASWRVSSSGRNRRRGFLLEIHVSKRLPIGVSYDETAIQFFDRPGGWEVALRHAPIM